MPEAGIWNLWVSSCKYLQTPLQWKGRCSGTGLISSHLTELSSGAEPWRRERLLANCSVCSGFLLDFQSLGLPCKVKMCLLSLCPFLYPVQLLQIPPLLSLLLHQWSNSGGNYNRVTSDPAGRLHYVFITRLRPSQSQEGGRISLQGSTCPESGCGSSQWFSPPHTDSSLTKRKPC